MNIKYNKALWLIIILAIVMMIPFLGLTDFCVLLTALCMALTAWFTHKRWFWKT